MTTLSGLLAVATVTLVKVKRGISASSQSRFQSVALFAAESGVSAGMDFLRTNSDPTTKYSTFISSNNSSVQKPTGIAGNMVPHGDTGNLFTSTVPMDYEVSILNNLDDPGYATGTDEDGIVVLRSIGRGPGTSMIIVEVEVSEAITDNTSRPCPGYAQQGISEDGAGRNDCLGTINFKTVTTFTPGS
ncbi:MAG: hypothetical protein GY811_15830 [Myxococcales bacterium]|nr:hypothetical protein [Myxococcales bacterium]